MTISDRHLAAKLIIGSLALDSNPNLASLAAKLLSPEQDPLQVDACATFVQQFRRLIGEAGAQRETPHAPYVTSGCSEPLSS